MFGRRRRYMPGRRGYGAGGLGILLLGMQLINLFNYFSRQNEYLPVTIGVLAVNLLGYFQPGRGWPSIQQACISLQKVWFEKQWKRMFYAPFFHSSDFHLYYNMASFIWKAIALEKHFGSGYFLYMVGVFSLATNLLYLAINFALAELLNQWSAVQSCAVGFSGVIFALKVVTTHIQPPGMTRVFGFIQVPMRLACWVELILISLLFPNVSFVGHLAGILVGLAWVYGPLQIAMDIPMSFITGTKSLFLPYLEILLSGEYRYIIIALASLIFLLLVFLIEMVPTPGQEGDVRRQPDGRSYTYRAGATGRRPPAEDGGTHQPRGTGGRPEHPRPSYTSYTYASGATGSTAGSHEDDTGLQEAIRRSLEHSKASSRPHRGEGHSPGEGHTPGDGHAPGGRPIREEEDRNLQEALNQTYAEAQAPGPPGEEFERPPPYNPAFQSPDDHDPPTHSREIGFVVGEEASYVPNRGIHESESIPAGRFGRQQPVADADSSGSIRRRNVQFEQGSSQTIQGELGASPTSTDNGSQPSHRLHHQSPLSGPDRDRDRLLSRQELRAARIQRFGSLSQQRAPLDNVNRRSSWLK